MPAQNVIVQLQSEPWWIKLWLSVLASVLAAWIIAVVRDHNKRRGR